MAWIRTRETRRGLVHFVQWRDHEGRVHSERVGYDLPLAKARCAVVGVQAEGLAPRPTSSEGPDVLLRLFQDHLTLAGKAAGTVAYYGKQLGLLCRLWKAVPLLRWTPALLGALVTERAWKPRRVAMILATARPWIRWAREAGYLMPDWTAGLKRPRVRAVHRQALTEEQVAALLQASRGRSVELPVHLAACAGLSRGDIRALTWADVDLREGWIRTRRRKTDEPIQVPIVEPLRGVLLARRGLHGLVCRDLPKRDEWLHASLRKACRAAGIPPCGFHALRHAWATMLVRGGVDVATIGRLLAHRPGSAVTLAYLHSDDERLRAAGAVIEKALTTG